MQRLLSLYVSVSLAASVLIVILLAAKPFWKHRLSKTWQYYVWLLVVARLLIPLSPVPGVIGGGRNGIAKLENTSQTAAGETGSWGDGTEKSHEKSQEKSAEDSMSEVSPVPGGPSEKWTGGAGSEPAPVLTAGDKPPSSWRTAAAKGALQKIQSVWTGNGGVSNIVSGIWLLWLIPAVLLICRQAVNYHRYLRALKKVSVPAESGELLSLCERAAMDLHIRRPVPVYYCGLIASPMAAGIVKPRILLPENHFSSSELYYIFRHELTHLKRKDILYKWLIQLTVSVHWFNPLVYLMRRECDQACELSCDESVISRLSREERREYGDTLIASLKHSHETPRHAASVLLCESTHTLKERLGVIMKTKKGTRLQKLTAALLTVLFAGTLLCLGSVPAKAEAESVSAAGAENGTGLEAGTGAEAGYEAGDGSGTGNGFETDNLSGAPVSKDTRLKKMKTFAGTDQWFSGLDNDWADKFFDDDFDDSFDNDFEDDDDFDDLEDDGDTVYTDPWLNDSNNPESKKWRHSFMTKSFFANRYGIRLAWNNEPSLYGTTRGIEAGAVTTVSFTEEMKQYADNAAVLEAIRLAILEQKELETPSDSRIWTESFIMTAPVVVEVSGPYNESYDQLTAKFYKENHLSFYSAVIKKASKAVQEAMVKRTYDDRKIPYFSCSLEGTSSALKAEYMNKTYSDNQISFFSLLCDETEPKVLKTYAERAYQDNNITFYSVSSGNLPQAEQKSLTYRAYEDGRLDCFMITCEALTKDERKALAERAKKEGKTNFYHVLKDYDD